MHKGTAPLFKDQLERKQTMISTIPSASIQELLEAGVHFGHKKARWNPKMAPYIYKTHHNVHIVDLPQTARLLKEACDALCASVKKGGRILFVGTKFQAKEAVKEAAERCGQYYVNHRWLGGMLTNWKTVSSSIRRLKAIEEKVASPEFESYTKKEQIAFHRTLEKYKMSLGGFREMGGLPNMLFVVDIRKDAIAIREARLLGIPIVGIVDTNVNPELVDYPIPGNDDGLRAIQLYCRFASDAVLAGLAEELSASEQKQDKKNIEKKSEEKTVQNSI